MHTRSEKVLLLVCLLSLAAAMLFWMTHQKNRNLLHQIKSNFTLQTAYQRKEVQMQIHRYQQHPEYLNKVFKQAKPYLLYIQQETAKYHMPGEIALLPFVESQYNPLATSSTGATGIWQLRPITAQRLGVPINWWYDGRRDVITSTQAALKYLAYLNKRFKGDWLLTLAAYNAGEHTILKATRKNQRRHLPTDFWQLPLPTETKFYIRKILALSAILNHPHTYAFQLTPINNTAYLTTVKLQSPITLHQAAKLAHVDTAHLKKLNPGFSRWATGPCTDCQLVLPTDKKSIFINSLSKLPSAQRTIWTTYKVQHKETPSQIAKRFHLPTQVLLDANHLSNHSKIYTNQLIHIPKTPRQS